MGLHATQRHVLSGPLDIKVCAVGVRLVETIIVRVSVLACCIYKEKICVAQNTDKTVVLTDTTAADYTGITEAYFTIWSGGIGGTQILQKTLTGGGIVIPADNKLQFDLSNTDTAIAPNVNYTWEAAIDTASSKQQVIGQGRFVVSDTGTYD